MGGGMTISRKLAAMAALLAVPLCVTGTAQAQADDRVLGEIFTVSFDFCPVGSASLDGQSNSVRDNAALYSLINTIYGGNAQIFDLPDLRGRSPMGTGFANGFGYITTGLKMGFETVVLSHDTMPPHTHQPVMQVSSTDATSRNPIRSYVADAGSAVFWDGTAPGAASTLAEGAIISQDVGGGGALDNMMPTLVLKYCIVTDGLYPTRDD